MKSRVNVHLCCHGAAPEGKGEALWARLLYSLTYSGLSLLVLQWFLNLALVSWVLAVVPLTLLLLFLGFFTGA